MATEKHYTARLVIEEVTKEQIPGVNRSSGLRETQTSREVVELFSAVVKSDAQYKLRSKIIGLLEAGLEDDTPNPPALKVYPGPVQIEV